MVPATLTRPGTCRFWLAVLLTGVGTGMGTAALTRLLEVMQQLAWHGNGRDLLDAVSAVDARRRVAILLAAGLLTGVGQIVPRRLSSSNGIDITEAAIAPSSGDLSARSPRPGSCPQRSDL